MSAVTGSMWRSPHQHHRQAAVISALPTGRPPSLLCQPACAALASNASCWNPPARGTTRLSQPRRPRAPHQHSGVAQGHAHIQCGRPCVRAALYMAALTALRSDAGLKADYQAMRAAGKHAKVALIATASKLIVAAKGLPQTRPAMEHTTPTILTNNTVAVRGLLGRRRRTLMVSSDQRERPSNHEGPGSQSLTQQPFRNDTLAETGNYPEPARRTPRAH